MKVNIYWWLSFNRINSGRSIPTAPINVGQEPLVFRRFNRINSGRSIPTKTQTWKHGLILFQSFNRINSGRSIPTKLTNALNAPGHARFNRINSGRSIPTYQDRYMDPFVGPRFNRINSGRSIPTRLPEEEFNIISIVSIVSIQADQSRLQYTLNGVGMIFHVFQSYQFRQINPDPEIWCSFFVYLCCFNRINSGRSIPTRNSLKQEIAINLVSIVSIQADQSRP